MVPRSGIAQPGGSSPSSAACAVYMPTAGICQSDDRLRMGPIREPIIRAGERGSRESNQTQALRSYFTVNLTSLVKPFKSTDRKRSNRRGTTNIGSPAKINNWHSDIKIACIYIYNIICPVTVVSMNYSHWDCNFMLYYCRILSRNKMYDVVRRVFCYFLEENK